MQRWVALGGSIDTGFPRKGKTEKDNTLSPPNVLVYSEQVKEYQKKGTMKPCNYDLPRT